MESVLKNEIGGEDSFENDMIQELKNEEEKLKRWILQNG